MRSFCILILLLSVLVERSSSQVTIGCLALTITNGNSLVTAFEVTQRNSQVCTESVLWVSQNELQSSILVGTGGILRLSPLGTGSIKANIEFRNFASVIIERLSFEGNASPVIFSTVDSISISNSNFTLTSNGALLINDADVSISNSNFVNNEGGAVAIVSPRSVSVSNSNFIGNKGERGSAIFLGTSSAIDASLSVDECNFLTNEADQEGGAIFTAVSSSISNSSFVENSAVNGGSSIYATSQSGYLQVSEGNQFEEKGEDFIVCLSPICPNISGVPIQTEVSQTVTLPSTSFSGIVTVVTRQTFDASDETINPSQGLKTSTSSVSSTSAIFSTTVASSTSSTEASSTIPVISKTLTPEPTQPFTYSAPSESVTKAILSVEGSISQEDAQKGMNKLEINLLNTQNGRFVVDSVSTSQSGSKRATKTDINFHITDLESSSSSSLLVLKKLNEEVVKKSESVPFTVTKLDVVAVNYAADSTFQQLRQNSQGLNSSSSSLVASTFVLFVLFFFA